LSEDSETHDDVPQLVSPTREDNDKTKFPKLAPEILIDVTADSGAFGLWMSKIAAASNVKNPRAVTIFSATSSRTVSSGPAAWVFEQITEVEVYQEVVVQRCVSAAPTSPMITVGVETLTPKFIPRRVRAALPLVGPFPMAKCDIRGPANVKAFARVPTCSSSTTVI
jgi:hypothetical protein